MQEITQCVPGRRSTATLEVTDDDTAIAMRSGDVPVLATPRVLALAEDAATSALDGCLEDHLTTVGSWVEIQHMAPSHVGATVSAEAVLMGVHGRRLEFAVYVMDGETEIAHIKHRRVIVERRKFGG